MSLWGAQEETKPRLGPRLCRRDPFEQPKQIIKTWLGQGDQANFTVDDIIETIRNSGYEDTVEERGQEAVDHYLSMKQREAEAI